MSSPEIEKEKAALERLDKFCKEHNEIADEETKRRAKISWIRCEIKKLNGGQLNRIIHEINLLKE